MENSTHAQTLYQARIQAVVTFIAQHLDQSLDLEQLARISLFSPFHFHRIFTGALGETPQDYVNRVRLERAANALLKSPERSITEIALSCGFSSPSTFSRSFKKHFGMSASKYARARRAGDSAPRPGEPSAVTPPVEPSVLPPPELRTMPQMHIAYLACLQGYRLELICRTWNRLFRWAQARELLTPETRTLGLSLDDPTITPRDKCRYYACLTIPPTTPSDPQVGRMEIPTLKCAVFPVVCGPAEIEPLYQAIYHQWLPESGFQPDDFPCYDLYRRPPESHPEGKCEMDICIPVTPL